MKDKVLQFKETFMKQKRLVFLRKVFFEGSNPDGNGVFTRVCLNVWNQSPRSVIRSQVTRGGQNNHVKKPFKVAGMLDK